MPEHDELMRVFWPTDIQTSDLRGVVVGWRNSGLDVFVVAVLEEVEVCRFEPREGEGSRRGKGRGRGSQPEPNWAQRANGKDSRATSKAL